MKPKLRKVSKWALWARRRKARHQCVRCGRKAKRHILCDTCHESELARKRLKKRLAFMRNGGKSLLTETWEKDGPFFGAEMDKLSEAAPIVAEICERLHELEEIRLGLAVDITTRLVRVSEISHMAFRYTVRLMHGDATIFNSFQQQAEDRAMSKQAAHAEFHAVLAVIEQTFPELSHQIEHIRGQVTRAEEPAHTNVNRQGLVMTDYNARA